MYEVVIEYNTTYQLGHKIERGLFDVIRCVVGFSLLLPHNLLSLQIIIRDTFNPWYRTSFFISCTTLSCPLSLSVLVYSLIPSIWSWATFLPLCYYYYYYWSPLSSIYVVLPHILIIVPPLPIPIFLVCYHITTRYLCHCCMDQQRTLSLLSCAAPHKGGNQSLDAKRLSYHKRSLLSSIRIPLHFILTLLYSTVNKCLSGFPPISHWPHPIWTQILCPLWCRLLGLLGIEYTLFTIYDPPQNHNTLIK